MMFIILLIVTVANSQHLGGVIPDGNDLFAGLPPLPSINQPLQKLKPLPKINPQPDLKKNTQTHLKKKQSNIKKKTLPAIVLIKKSTEVKAKMRALSAKMNTVKSMEDLVNVFKLDNALSFQKVTGKPKMVVPDNNIQYNFVRKDVRAKLGADGKVMDLSFIVLPNKGCSPITKTIDTQTMMIGKTNQEGLFWPRCFELQQCGGCCHDDLRECTPVETEKLVRSFILITYDLGYTTIKHELSEHKTCACQCKLKPEHCVGYQEFNNDNCRCECTVAAAECKERKQWSPSSCNCICSDQHPRCVLPEVWSLDICKCVNRK